MADEKITGMPTTTTVAADGLIHIIVNTSTTPDNQAIKRSDFEDSFGTITATSYGGITEANLLDKAATETISGVFSFSAGPVMDNNVFYSCTETDSTVRTLLGINANDLVLIGNPLIATQLRGSSVDIPTALTANSYGGITEANLVDKAATETITGNRLYDGLVQIKERTDAGSDTTAYGQIWVRTVTPNQLWFTDDAGTDAHITAAITKFKTANKDLASNTSFENDDHLAGWALITNKHYKIDGWIHYLQNVGDIKMKFQFDNAPSAVGSCGYSAFDVSGDTAADHVTAVTSNFVVTTLTDQEKVSVFIKGGFQANATTGGTMNFQWAQNTSSANNTTVSQESWITITQMD